MLSICDCQLVYNHCTIAAVVSNCLTNHVIYLPFKINVSLFLALAASDQRAIIEQLDPSEPELAKLAQEPEIESDPDDDDDDKRGLYTCV